MGEEWRGKVRDALADKVTDERVSKRSVRCGMN